MSKINGTIVRLKISCFSNTRKDKTITQETLDRNHLGKKAGRWSKHRIDDGYLKPVKKIESMIRAANAMLTLSWEEGQRLVTMTALPKHQAAVQEWQQAYADAIDAFMLTWPAAVESSRVMHNGTWDESDYPNPGKVREEFGLEIGYEPIPDSSHFIANVHADQLASMQAALEATNNRRIENAVNDVWDQILEPLNNMVDRLSNPDMKIYDTLVENIRDISNRVPLLNITGSPELAEAKNRLDGLIAGLSSDALRANKSLRATTAASAANLVAALGQRKFAA